MELFIHQNHVRGCRSPGQYCICTSVILNNIRILDLTIIAEAKTMIFLMYETLQNT